MSRCDFLDLCFILFSSLQVILDNCGMNLLTLFRLKCSSYASISKFYNASLTETAVNRKLMNARFNELMEPGKQMTAVSLNNIALMEILIDRGAKVDELHSKMGSPLHIAASYLKDLNALTQRRSMAGHHFPKFCFLF